MQELIPVLAGGGSVGTVILGVIVVLSRSFRGISDQWSVIFRTQETQIAELRKQLQDTREDAAEDRGRFETEILAAKLAEKACREDWMALSVEVRDLRRVMETKVSKVNE